MKRCSGLRRRIHALQDVGAQELREQQNVDLQQGKVDQLTAALDADDAAIGDRANPARLHHHHGAERRAHRRAAGRSWQRGARLGCGPIATLVLAQPAAVMFTLPSRVLDDVRQAMERGRSMVIAYDQDNRLSLSTASCCWSTTRSTRRPPRSGSRPSFPMRRPAVAGRVRECPLAAGDAQQRRRGAGERDPARAAGLVAWIVTAATRGARQSRSGRPAAI